MDAIICYAKCDGCAWGFGEACFDPPEWHTWAGPEDIEHARDTGQPDPTTQRCGCSCAEVVTPSRTDRQPPTTATQAKGGQPT